MLISILFMQVMSWLPWDINSTLESDLEFWDPGVVGTWSCLYDLFYSIIVGLLTLDILDLFVQIPSLNTCTCDHQSLGIFWYSL